MVRPLGPIHTGEMAEDVLSVDDARRHLADVVARVDRQHARAVLVRDERAAAVLVNPDELDAIEDTLDVLADPTALKAIAAAEDAIAGGSFHTADELAEAYHPL